MATMAIRRSRRIARCRYRRRQSESQRTAACAASTSKKRSRALPCLLMWPSRCNFQRREHTPLPLFRYAKAASQFDLVRMRLIRIEIRTEMKLFGSPPVTRDNVFPAQSCPPQNHLYLRSMRYSDSTFLSARPKRKEYARQRGHRP